MINIIDDINNRVKAAEEARDAAISEVKKIKETIAKNHIVFREGRAYTFIGSGHYQGYMCAHCPFIEWTSADSYRCSMRRDSTRCADAGGRFYEVSELRKDFKKRMISEETVELMAEEIERLREALLAISETASKEAQKGGDRSGN